MRFSVRFWVLLPVALALMVPSSAFGNGPHDVRPTPEEALEGLGISTSLGSLESVVTDDTYETDTRALAALAIGRSKDQTSAPILIDLLSDPDPNIRGAAIVALRFMEFESAVPQLTAVLRTEPIELLQQVAIPALEAIGGDLAVRALLDAAKNPNKSELTRANALSAIQRLEVTKRLDYATVKSDVVPLLGDASANVRSMAAHVMAAGNDDSAVPHLVRAALDDQTEQWVRIRAIKDLEILTERQFGYFKSGTSPAEESKRQEAMRRLELWWLQARSSYE